MGTKSIEQNPDDTFEEKKGSNQKTMYDDNVLKGYSSVGKKKVEDKTLPPHHEIMQYQSCEHSDT